MGWFKKTSADTCLLAIRVHEAGVSAACVKRDSSETPRVELAAFFPGRSSEVPPLERVAKELQAARFQCSNLLANGEYQILSVDAPNVPPDELKTAIRWRLKDMLDFHIDDATIDVLDVPVEKNAPVRAHSMYAVAARNQLIEKRQAMFSEAKIPLRVIDIPEMAQRNISALVEPEGRGVAMLSFDAEGGLLTVTFSAELYLSRRIDIPLDQLRQVDVEQRNTVFDRVTLELQRSLDHLDRQYHFIPLAKLVLAPMGEAGSWLREYLAANLYVPVELLDLQDVLDVSKVPELKLPDEQHRYFLTLGAALRQEEKGL